MKLGALLTSDVVLDPVAACLALRGHEVSRASVEELAARARAVAGIDLVVLPWSLDLAADASLCRAVRAAAPEVTLALAGALPEPPALAALLDAGADAHLATALGAPLLLAQILVLERARRARERHAATLADGEELRHRMAGLEAIIEHAPLAIVAVDYAGNVTRWNPAAERLFGWTATEALGHPDPVIRKGDWPAFQVKLENAFCGKLDPLEETEGVRKDGSTITVSSARALLCDAHGAPTGVVALIADITEKKQFEAKLRVTDRLASVGRLAATVGHEINNPLTYVLSNMNLVLEPLADLPPGSAGSLDPEQIEMLREARDGAERVRHIVRDLRMFSKDDAEEPGPVDPRRVLDACVNITRVELRHCARVVRSYTQTPRVLANEARLGQVLLNLIINAADSIVGDDPDRNEIRLLTRTAEDGRVTIEVRDTGVGMSKEVLKRIFEPFFTTKSGTRGTGLGLSVCYSIVSALGGEITVDSEVGRGTSVRVHLPAVPAAKAAGGALTASPREIRMSTPKPESMEAKGARGRVLVVDDEVQVAKAIARFLREHDVTLAENGEAALTAIRTQAPFDAILCDLMMPHLTGMEVYEQIRVERPGLEERVIFMSGGVFTDHAAAFLTNVTNPRLEKPFKPGAVKAAVELMIVRTRGQTIRRIEALTDEQFQRIAPFLEADLDIGEDSDEVDKAELIRAIDHGLESARTGQVLDHDVVMAMARQRLSSKP